jgi:glycosyltransferase involved in cell wall biosynthesis
MRILTFTSLFPNTVDPNFGIFIFQRASHLAQREGNQVEVVAPVPYAPKFLKGTARGSVAAIPSAEVVGNLRVYHPRYPLLPKLSMPWHGLLMYAGCMRCVKSLHQQCRFDCIDAHYVYPDGLAAVLMGRSLGIPVVVTARGSDIHTFRDFATVRPQIKWALRHAAGVVAVSDSLARIMHDLEPALRNVQVIGNGVDSRRFFREDRLVARAQLGLNPSDRIVVSVAALKHVKGPDLLVRAASLLKQSLAHCQVLFVGAGPELGALQQLAKQLDCADICRFVGPVANEQLRTYSSAADVSCLASRDEGWPNVILESLACGTPVVATGVGAAPQLLANPELGIIVDPTSEAICAGLSQALQREWNPQTISAYAQGHTWENVAASVEVVLKRATESGPGS